MVPKPKHFQNYEHETIDDYDINEKIREDNNTVLFVGRNLTSHKYVTIKAFHILKTHPKNVTDIVRKEFDTLKEIKHENLAPLLGFFCNAESVFIVTPFFPDGDMQKYIMESGGRSEAEAAEIFHQIVSAVAVLHAHGIAHGDLRMSNIAITKYPNVCVTGNQFAAGVGVNRLYASPEAICRIRHDDKCADVWALGIILFCLQVMSMPWTSTNANEVREQVIEARIEIPPSVSRQIADVILACTRKNPDERPTVEEIMKMEWLQGENMRSVRSMGTQMKVTLAGAQNRTAGRPSNPTLKLPAKITLTNRSMKQFRGVSRGVARRAVTRSSGNLSGAAKSIH